MRVLTRIAALVVVLLILKWGGCAGYAYGSDIDDSLQVQEAKGLTQLITLGIALATYPINAIVLRLTITVPDATKDRLGHNDTVNARLLFWAFSPLILPVIKYVKR